MVFSENRTLCKDVSQNQSEDSYANVINMFDFRKRGIPYGYTAHSSSSVVRARSTSTTASNETSNGQSNHLTPREFSTVNFDFWLTSDQKLQ